MGSRTGRRKGLARDPSREQNKTVRPVGARAGLAREPSFSWVRSDVDTPKNGEKQDIPDHTNGASDPVFINS